MGIVRDREIGMIYKIVFGLLWELGIRLERKY